MKPETRFRINHVVPFLKKLPNTYFMSIQQLAISGDPDLILCVRGRFVALELKAEGEKPRKLQEYKLEKIRKAGGIRLVASPENWSNIKQVLVNMDKGDKDEHW